MNKQEELYEYEKFMNALTPEEIEKGTRSLLEAIAAQQRNIDHSMSCINAEMEKEVQDV